MEMQIKNGPKTKVLHVGSKAIGRKIPISWKKVFDNRALFQSKYRSCNECRESSIRMCKTCGSKKIGTNKNILKHLIREELIQ